MELMVPIHTHHNIRWLWSDACMAEICQGLIVACGFTISLAMLAACWRPCAAIASEGLDTFVLVSLTTVSGVLCSLDTRHSLHHAQAATWA